MKNHTYSVFVFGLLLAVSTALFGQASTASEHVFYFGSQDQDIHELRYFFNAFSGAFEWATVDWTQSSSAPVPASNSNIFGAPFPSQSFQYPCSCGTFGCWCTGTHNPGSAIYFVGRSNSHIYTIYGATLSGLTYKDITSASAAPLPLGGSRLSGFHDSTGRHLFYLGTNNNIYQLVMLSGSSSWTYGDPSTNCSGADCSGLPIAGSDLVAYSDGVGEHLFYFDANEHIHSMWFQNNASSWINGDTFRNQTGATTPPKPGSPIAAYSDGTGEHTVYLDASNHIHHMWFPSGSSGPWQNADMTLNTGAAPARSDTYLKAFSDISGNEIVYYTGGDNDVHQMYLCAGCGHSVSQNLTPGGPANAANSPVKGFSDALGQQGFYVSSTTDIRWLRLQNGTWSNSDPTAMASAQPAAPNTPISAFPCVDQQLGQALDNCE